MHSNVLYYSRMNPNEIHSRADQYLRGVGGERAHNLRLNPIAAMFESIEPIKPLPPPPKPSQQFDESLSQTRTPMVPRIGNKIFTIEPLELIFKHVSVKVTQVTTPPNFYVVIQEIKDEYEAMKQQLKTFYEATSYCLPINENFYYAAKMIGSQDWGRVKIINSFGSYYYCLFIDEGITFYYPEDKLFLLDDRFKNLPPRCFKARLLGLECPVWSFSITNIFKTLVLDKELMAFAQTCDDDIYKCILTSNGLNLNEELSKQLT